MLSLQFVVMILLNITCEEANILNLVFECLIENKNSYQSPEISFGRQSIRTDITGLSSSVADLC